MASQKLSVQKALRRKFRRYLAATADFNGLVLLKLQVPRVQPRVQGSSPEVVHLSCMLALAPDHLQECLRDARRVEAITGQQLDEANYVVSVRCGWVGEWAVGRVRRVDTAGGGACAPAGLTQPAAGRVHRVDTAGGGACAAG